MKRARTEASLDPGGIPPNDEAMAARQSENDQTSNIQEYVSTGQSEVLKTRKATKPSNKKPTAKKRKNSKVGRLEALMHMPVDIFCEIASHLSPVDLLNMSRASKQLRAFLTSKNSKSIWRAARNAIKLPECPSDLSEMQYADLLFSKGCYLCASRRTQGLHFRLRLRLCASCRDKNLTSGLGIMRDLGCVEEFLNLLTNDHFSRTCTGKLYYNVNEARIVWDHLRSLTFDSKFDECKDFVAERERKVKSTVENALLVEAWLKRREFNKREEQRMIRIERERAIINRLKEIGHSQSDLDGNFDTVCMHNEWFSLLQDDRPLTERIWKNILPKLQLVISERQVRRAALENIFPHGPNCECDDCIEDSFCECPHCMEANLWITEDEDEAYDEDEDDGTPVLPDLPEPSNLTESFYTMAAALIDEYEFYPY